MQQLHNSGPNGVKSEQRDVRVEQRKINEIFKDKFNYNILQG